MVTAQQKPIIPIRDKLDELSIKIKEISLEYNAQKLRQANRNELAQTKKELISHLTNYDILEPQYLELFKQHHASYSLNKKRVSHTASCIEYELLERFPSLN